MFVKSIACDFNRPFRQWRDFHIYISIRYAVGRRATLLCSIEAASLGFNSIVLILERTSAAESFVKYRNTFEISRYLTTIRRIAVWVQALLRAQVLAKYIV